MNQDDINKLWELVGKPRIQVSGDYVEHKHVEYEVNNFGTIESGGVTFPSKEEPKALTSTEAEVFNAIEAVQKEKDEQGHYIMHDYDQWYAIFRVLSRCCGYPTKPKDFEKTMRNMGSDNLRIPCQYDNFRKVTLNKLPQNVALWSQYAKTADQYTQKQISVAILLMKTLKIA